MKSLKTLVKRAEEEIKTDEDLIVLTLISSLLAGFGVALGNVFILIGAMLTAPFIEPMISMVVLFFSGDLKKATKALESMITILVISLMTTFLFFFLYSFIDPALHPFEMITIPPFEALLIAILLGIVGMLLWIWPKASNTSAGVAIAISLLPPLTTVSLGIVIWDINVVTHSLFMLFVNLLGITFGSYAVLVLKYKKINLL